MRDCIWWWQKLQTWRNRERARGEGRGRLPRARPQSTLSFKASGRRRFAETSMANARDDPWVSLWQLCQLQGFRRHDFEAYQKKPVTFNLARKVSITSLCPIRRKSRQKEKYCSRLDEKECINSMSFIHTYFAPSGGRFQKTYFASSAGFSQGVKRMFPLPHSSSFKECA